ncbi:MAG: Ectoine dioxygenase [Verrucomicrobiae bacterium]|nr:Ectoine dioxygenase [Verrucomicrobiae bacterium]
MRYLTPQQFAQYQRDGYLVIDDFLTTAQLQNIRAEIAQIQQDNAGLTRDTGGFNLEKVGGDSLNPDAPVLRAGMLRKIQGAVFYLASVKDVFTTGKLLDCMEDIMGPAIYYHSSKVMFKPAHGGAAKPWHQDAAYWRNYEPSQVTVWIAIDDATEANGCVWAIPGSHKLGLIPHVHKELQVPESRIDLTQAAPVPVRAGGLLIFHSLVLHMSKANTSANPRCAIICDYDCQPHAAMDARGAVGVWTLREAAGA